MGRNLVLDCVLFAGEVDLLELRIRELQGVVDRVIVVEATKTFTGAGRTPVFPQHEARFQPWRDRIDYLLIDDLPATDNPWVREWAQRNGVLRALDRYDPADLVLLSDADEIPFPHLVPVGLPSGIVFAYLLQDYCYALNCRVADEFAIGTKACTVETLRALTPQTVRDIGRTATHPRTLALKPGGWHFSYLGPAARIALKLASFSHQELHVPEFAFPARITAAMEELRDPIGRPRLLAVDVDREALPSVVQADPSAWRELLFPAGLPRVKRASPTLTIITPWLNNGELIPAFEAAVAGADQLIIIDNASAPAAAAALAALCRRHRNGLYLRNDRNVGFAPANNQGLRAATSDLVMFLNNDVAAEAGWLDRVRIEAEASVLAGPALGSQSVLAEQFPYLEGWCIAGLRADFMKLGGWGEQFVAPYWEDTDLCARAMMLGLRLRRANWKVKHLGGRTTRSVPTRGEGFEANRLLFLDTARRLIAQRLADAGTPREQGA